MRWFIFAAVNLAGMAIVRAVSGVSGRIRSRCADGGLLICKPIKRCHKDEIKEEKIAEGNKHGSMKGFEPMLVQISRHYSYLPKGFDLILKP